MKRRLLIIFSFLLLSLLAHGQTKSPQVFLGYPLGERFTPHHRIVDYFEHVAAHNENVILKYYGETFEHRPLLVVWVSAQENIDQLEEIRIDNLRRTGLEKGNPTTSVPITWLSYNVHGNEAVSSEAAMKTLWALVDPAKGENKAWLQNNLVVIDPCVNPDGRDRYVNWYNQKMNVPLQPDLQSIEHQEPWPGGRANHYLFDLNRDWAWQTQQESQQRMTLYQQWMPNIHLDFHEQGINSPYYFAPAAIPLHPQLSDYQMEFQETFGRQNAAYFDQHNWFYFTKEVFDLLYPSYGDTYPMFNGAIGMTIEQGGSGAAGIGVHTAEGDTLTLKERIRHHHTTGMTAIEVASKNAKTLLEEFSRYFEPSPKGKYTSFVIKGDNSAGRITGLLSLLDKNHIQYRLSGKTANLQGFSYQKGQKSSFSLEKDDIIVNVWQPKSVLTQVLFEPEAQLQDSLTYDITSWALPYAYGVEAYALQEKLEGNTTYPQQEPVKNDVDKSALAYIVPWQDASEAIFLAALLQEDIRVRSASYPFTVDGQTYPTGSLIITRGGNEYVKDFHQKVVTLANTHQIVLGTASTGFMDKGKDFGSRSVKTIKAPKVGVFSGEGVSSLNFGEVWHFFEQQLQYPISVLEASAINHLNLTAYDELILPSGSYDWNDKALEKLNEWTQAGGKLIVIESALDLFVDKDGFDLSTYLSDQQQEDYLPEASSDDSTTSPYRERERQAISDYAAGAVFEVDMDSTYALGYGTGGKYYTLKNNPTRYAFLNNGINAGVIHSLDQHRSGFIGYRAKAKMKESLVFGVENRGKGQLVYLVDNPLFRSFWENGKLIMANAVFLVGN